MLIHAIGGLNFKSKNKTQSVSNTQYLSKVNSNNIGDTVSFGLLEPPSVTKETQKLLDKVIAKGKQFAIDNPSPDNTNGLCLNLKDKWAYFWPTFDNATQIMFNIKKTRNTLMIFTNSNNKIDRVATGTREKAIEFAEFYDKKKSLNKTVQKYLNLFLEKGTQHRNDLADLEP